MLALPVLYSQMLGAAKGMLALHARDPPIVHQHITSTTLVVDRHWEVKVNSFTLSSVGVSGRESGLLTNPRYLAPEVLDGQPATTKSVGGASFGRQRRRLNAATLSLVTWQAMRACYNC